MKILAILVLFFLLQGCKKKVVDDNDILVIHSFYVVHYNLEKKNPNWVCWEICSSNKTVDRKNMRFIKDPLVPTPSPLNYRGSGYDLGHMCPAGDMSFDYTALKETFYMSNISPQNPNLNRGDWRELEASLHNEGKLTNIYCIAGTYWSDNLQTIGDENVRIPFGFWKVAFGGTGETERAWFFFNVGGNRKISEYSLDVSKLEAMTGVNFRSCTNILIGVKKR